MAFGIARHISAPIALRRSGLSSTRRPTGPSRSTRSLPLLMLSPSLLCFAAQDSNALRCCSDHVRTAQRRDIPIAITDLAQDVVVVFACGTNRALHARR